MCGIFAFLSKQSKPIAPEYISKLEAASAKIQHRGPDNTKHKLVTPNLWISFHRLAINGLDTGSDQPLVYQDEKSRRTITVICNGEIYNYPELRMKYERVMKTHNDCEAIIHLYLQQDDFPAALHQLDGVFSIILHDSKYNKLFVANDRFGIRPLFYGQTAEGDLVWASEQVALIDLCPTISWFTPGHYQTIDLGSTSVRQSEELVRYYEYKWPINRFDLPTIYDKYRTMLEAAVYKRIVLAERPIACLLSGGLDSSIICALSAKIMKQLGRGPLHTFSIGFSESPDLKYARIMAEHIGSVHHEVVKTEQEFLDAIPEVIRAIQSFDITTVRASCGNYLIAKYIRETTDFKIILSGDVSEEIHASYYYSRFAPSPMDFALDNIRLMKEVHKYDVLRASRCIEHFGMEPRVPYADYRFVEFVMSIPAEYKMHGPGTSFPMEKMLMRIAFMHMLPTEICWRPKVAFSDGVSNKAKSWYQVIQEYVDKLISDEEFACHGGGTKPLSISKEAYWYRQIYQDLLGKGQDKLDLIGEYWMPRFIKSDDPSARKIGSD